MAATNTQTPAGAPVTAHDHEALQARLLKILDGGPAAIDERLKELDAAAANLANPSLRTEVIAGGERILHKLFGARFAPKTGDVDALDVERERIALRALRGDFQHLPTIHEIEDRHALLRLEGEGGPAVEGNDKLDHQAAVDAVLDATGN